MMVWGEQEKKWAMAGCVLTAPSGLGRQQPAIDAANSHSLLPISVQPGMSSPIQVRPATEADIVRPSWLVHLLVGRCSLNSAVPPLPSARHHSPDQRACTSLLETSI